MIQLAWQDAMPARVSRQEYNVATGELASEKLIRWRAERSFHRRPFLIRESFDVIKAAAADDSDAMLRFHARGLWRSQGETLKRECNFTCDGVAQQKARGTQFHGPEFGSRWLQRGAKSLWAEIALQHDFVTRIAHREFAEVERRWR